MSHWNTEAWGNFVTLATVAFTFWVMLVFMVKRTWKWNGLGRSLTGLTVALAALFSISTMALFYPNLWPVEVRWALRTVLECSCIGVILTLAFEKPEPTVAERVVEATGRLATATEVIAEQGVIKNEREG